MGVSDLVGGREEGERWLLMALNWPNAINTPFLHA